MTASSQSAVAIRKLAKDFKIMIVTQALWLLTVFALVGWWGFLLMKQNDHIAELEKQSGTFSQITYEKTQRMLLWEGGAFICLLLATSAVLIWLYWRDVRRSKSLSAFFASVTHELKTPLTSIRLQAESIADKSVTEKQKAPMAERLLQDTSRLETQVERTLELARVEGGGDVLTQQLEIKPWFEQTLDYWREARLGKISISTTLEDQAIKADTSALQVILKNLLDNSLKHSHNEEDLQVKIDSHSNGGDYVEIDFLDNGNGYSGNVRDLGQLFHKGSHSQGTGVGLYLIKVLMQRMGGEVRFANREDGESGFVAKLRFKKAHSIQP